MKLNAIATNYRGTRFRSRLEARWACFFDLAGWSWDYEPCDVPGWTPDFLLHGARNPVFVEVKPIAWTESPKADVEREDLAKARLGGGRDSVDEFAPEVLVLGLGPFRSINDACLGVFVDELWGTQPDLAFIEAGHNYPIDFRAELGSYAYRMGGQWDGDHHIRAMAEEDLPFSMWRMAGSMVQWKGEPANGLRPVSHSLQDIIQNLKPKGRTDA